MNKNERKPVGSDLLRSFCVISEQGHLTAAATILGRTQSAISVQLRKLENELGVVLFTRTPQGMVLTPCGEQLLPVAKAALAELTTVRRLFDDQLTGTIRVGIPDDYDDFVLERVLAAFARNNPLVEVTAISGCTSGFAAMIDKGALDVAVVSQREQQGDTPFSVARTVWAVEATTQVDPTQPVPLVLLDRQCWWKEIATDALRAADRPYRVMFKSSSFANLKAAIRAGLGVGILPAGSLGSAMRKLGPAEGFPVLPAAHRRILVNPDSASNLTAAMVRALRDKV